MRGLLVAALIGLAAALLAPTAANAAPCWQRVLDDWGDGHFDAAYPVHCYRDALRNLPEDLRVYGTAQNDIQNALGHALTRRPRSAAPVVARHSRARVTTKAQSSQAQSPAPARTRRLSARSTKQPKLRLTAAATGDDTSSGFPLVPVVAGALALTAALVAVASLCRHVPRRRRH